MKKIWMFEAPHTDSLPASSVTDPRSEESPTSTMQGVKGGTTQRQLKILSTVRHESPASLPWEGDRVAAAMDFW